MWMPNKNGAEPPAEDEPSAETQSTLRGTFRHVYRFILQAVKGDRAAADAIFEDSWKTIRRITVYFAALRQCGSSKLI
jgi:hypothetical protein